jgi:membrane protease YdiL (CAAX protease family)
MTENKLSLQIAFILVIGGWIFTIFISLVISLLSEGDAFSSNRWYFILTELAILAPAIVYFRWRKRTLLEHVRLVQVNRKVILASVLIGVGISILGDATDRIIQMYVETPEFIQGLTELFIINNTWDAFGIIGGVVFVAGVVEEMIFRGLLQKTLEERLPSTTSAILISSGIFTLLHSNPWWLLQIFFIGITLGYVAYRSKSIIPAIIIHMINNGFALIVLNTGESTVRWYSWGYQVSPIIVVLGGVLFYYGIRILTVEYPQTSLKKVDNRGI